MGRINRKKIVQIQTDIGVTISGKEEVKTTIVNHFENLLGVSNQEFVVLGGLIDWKW